MQVSNLYQLLSDHAALHCELWVNEDIEPKSKQEKREKISKLQDHYIWDDRSTKTYSENFNSKHIRKGVDQIMQCLNKNRLYALITKSDIIFKHLLTTKTNTKKVRQKHPNKQS